MRNLLLIGVGGLSVVTAIYMWTATQHWYDTIPGVNLTGPLNFHFAKDVALAYLTSGLALIWAGVTHDKTVGFFLAPRGLFYMRCFTSGFGCTVVPRWTLLRLST